MGMNVFQILISVLFFTAIIGTIATQISDTGENGTGANITGSALVLYGLITLVVVAGFVVGMAKSQGLMKGRR